jgi:hypothetical protein
MALLYLVLELIDGEPLAQIFKAALFTSSTSPLTVSVSS